MTAHPPSGLFDSLFDSDGTIFMGSRRNPADCRVGLFGVPYDGTTSFRPGTRFGPAAIREVSTGLETYCPQLDLDLEDLDFADLGAVEIPFGNPEPVLTKVKQTTEAVLGLGLRPLMLGGEHSISSGAVEAVAQRHPDLVLVQLVPMPISGTAGLAPATAMPAPCAAAWRFFPARRSFNSRSAVGPERNSTNCMRAAG